MSEPKLSCLISAASVPQIAYVSKKTSVARKGGVVGEEKLRIAKDGFPPLRYDANGNRATKTTSFGSIRYWYDKENRLSHSGSDAGRGTDYIYDKNGNLIEKKNLYKTDIYSYTGSNRID